MKSPVDNHCDRNAYSLSRVRSHNESFEMLSKSGLYDSFHCFSSLLFRFVFIGDCCRFTAGVSDGGETFVASLVAQSTSLLSETCRAQTDTKHKKL